MDITIIYDHRQSEGIDAIADSENLWLKPDDLRAATGWELKPEGACLGEQCVPIPRGREAEYLRDDGQRFNLAAFGRLRDQQIVHDDRHRVWVFGDAPAARTQALRTLGAPDFTLPDLDGRTHSLADYQGMKRVLMAWASW